MTLAFAGTPRFAAWALRELAERGRRPDLVISQPDRRRGRGLSDSAPRAVVEAESLGIPVLQTDDINSSEVVQRLRSCGVSTLVVAAFGQILRRAVLEGFLCVNIHGSLLPRYRGPAPIERAIMAGETKTGVTIMRVTAGVDEGPWAEQASLQVDPEEDAGALGRRLAVLGGEVLARVLDQTDEGTVEWKSQEGPSSYAGKLGAEDCRLDLSTQAKRCHDQVRALSPYVGVRGSVGRVAVKLWKTRAFSSGGASQAPEAAADAVGCPGVTLVKGERLFLGCGEGVLEVLEVQPLNKARMGVPAFLRGYSCRL